MINKALRLIRQYHQKSQSELAIELSITKEQLISIESGKSPVNGELLQRYSDLFDIPVSSLVFFSESIGREGKHAKKIRNSLAGKVLNVLEWMSEKNGKRKKSKLKIQSKGKAYCLTDSPLYKLSTKKRLSKILNQSTLELTALCCDAGNYSEFEDVGKNGKPRKIQKPLVKLDVIHTRIASLLSRIKVPDYLHSGKKKHSKRYQCQST